MDSTKQTIQEALLVSNEEFSSQGIQFKLLKNCTETIPTLVEWIYEEWKPYDASLTKEKLLKGFNARLNVDKIPLAVVALKNGVPIGTISLKTQGEPEFKSFPEDAAWLGSLEVIKNERKQGLGEALLKIATVLADRLGYESIYVYTSNPANIPWFLKRGAYQLEMRPFRNHTITILQIPCIGE